VLNRPVNASEVPLIISQTAFDKMSSTTAALNITCAVLSLTTFTFFLIGVIGYSNENTTVENVNWFHSYGTGSSANSNSFIGLERIVFQIPGQPTTASIYRDCNNKTCNVCEREGENAFALLIISVIFSFFSLLLSVAGSVAHSKAISGANLASSLVATVFGVIGWGLFVNKCYNKITDNINQDFDYGPGAVLTLIAFLLSFIVFILQIVATALPVGTSAPPPRSEPVATNEL
jgi:amino acid transporter